MGTVTWEATLGRSSARYGQDGDRWHVLKASFILRVVSIMAAQEGDAPRGWHIDPPPATIEFDILLATPGGRGGT